MSENFDVSDFFLNIYVALSPMFLPALFCSLRDHSLQSDRPDLIE